MSLKRLGFIPLPPHILPGGFDHAAVSRATGRLYVAHTVNDAIDVIDCTQDRYLHSISGLTGVAGALVSDKRNLIFTSNRGENTVDIIGNRCHSELPIPRCRMRPYKKRAFVTPALAAQVQVC